MLEISSTMTRNQFSIFTLIIHRSIIITLFFVLNINVLKAQNTPHLIDIAHMKLNIGDFDSSLSEENRMDRMICKGWCDDMVITIYDTIHVKYNFDLMESLLYINIDEFVFTAKNNFLISFIIDGKKFINHMEPGSEESMILELVVDGPYKLYRHHGIIYKKPNYDPVLNIGNKSASYKNSYKYYTFCNERLINLSSQIKKSVKKLHQECNTPKSLNVKGDIIDLFKMLNNT